MRSTEIENSVFVKVIVFLQLSSFMIYLNFNIVNVGGLGVGLPILALSAISSCLLFTCLMLRKKVGIHVHFFLFSLLIAWISIRVLIDIGDMEYLKQITVATTGGILLFYLIGGFIGIGFDGILGKAKRSGIIKPILILFFFLLVQTLYEFSFRIRDDIWYLKDVNGNYQRSGNFLSISFILISFLYFSLELKKTEILHRKIDVVFWLAFYSLLALMAVVCAQLFGSNSSTMVVSGVYIITVVACLVATNKSILRSYLLGTLSLPWSAKFIKISLKIVFLFVIFMAFFVSCFLFISDFNFDLIRLTGFGSGSNASLMSRLSILLNSGLDQLNYSPIWGNINVAYIVTGNAGRNLHSFFPYVLANLGVVGLLLVLTLFLSVFYQLYLATKRSHVLSLITYQKSLIAIYSSLIFAFLIIFANISVDVSWIVLWFTLGFISKPFGFKK